MIVDLHAHYPMHLLDHTALGPMTRARQPARAGATRRGYTAFGSDLDGFIKPTMPGLETPAAFARVEQRLIQKYGAAIAGQICSGNALRVLRYWGQ